MVLSRLAVLALAAGSIAGCGEEGGAPATTSDEPPASGATALVVTLDADGQGGEPAQTKEFDCVDDDCFVEVSDFDPVPPGSACTEIYGGPDVVTIEGELDGERVTARLVRTNGCEIERFDRFVPLLKELFPDYEPGGALRG